MRPVPLLLNSIAKKYNLNVLPYWYLSPKDYNIGIIKKTRDTYTIHHFDGKWVKKGVKSSIKRTIHKAIYLIIGRKGHNRLVHAIRPLIKH